MRFSPLLGALSLGSLASAFYLPGVAPTDYKKNDKVPLYVNRLTPSASETSPELHAMLSYNYYHPMLNFCQPKDGPPHQVSESLGSILFGDRILTSPFELLMGRNETCKKLCGTREYGPKEANFVSSRVWQNYYLNMLVDGLPASTKTSDGAGKEYHSLGFPLGYIGATADSDHPSTFIFNHYKFYIDYHQVSSRGRGRSSSGKDANDNARYRVVGVTVMPESRRSTEDKHNPSGANCADSTAMALNVHGHTDVLFTYSVFWRPSATAWATRWDRYLAIDDPNIHWFSLVNSAIIVVFLTSMVGMVLLRALRKDIRRYNQLDLNEDVQDDSGWKLVHGDVLRAPRNPMLLSVLLGSGAQLVFMAGATIAFALLGFLSPSNRGSLGTAAILLYSLLGFVGGYVSARVYKALGGDAWKNNIILTPVLVPAIVFGVFFFLNLFVFFHGSSGAVPFGTMLALVCIWFVISVPLSAAGSWCGFRAPVPEPPVRTNQIPRQIPPSPTYLRPIPSMLLAGILPFGAIFVELYFIMNSIWFHKVYYMFGFLFVCYGIMVNPPLPLPAIDGQGRLMMMPGRGGNRL